MQAIAVLTLEHRVYERVLAALEAVVREAVEKQSDLRGALARILEFLTAFTDEIHHPKEVGVLLAHLVELELAEARGPASAMLGDHVAVRRWMNRLEALSLQAEPWTSTDVERLARHAANLTSVMRGHMAQEEALLFELARRALSPEAVDRVEAMFCRHAFVTDERLQELTAVAVDLVGRWAPTDAPDRREDGTYAGRGGLVDQVSRLAG